MKKFLLTLVGVICSLGMWAEDVTYTLTLNNGVTQSTANYFTVSTGGGFNSKYTGTYNGTTFTKGLKLSSASSIAFTTTASSSTVKIVQSTSSNGTNTFKFDGTEVANNTGVANPNEGDAQVLVFTFTDVKAGSHSFTNKSETGILYVEVTESSSKAASDLAVAETASVNIGASTDVTYTTSSTGDVSVASSNESVATATVDATSKTVTISGVAEGTATITLSQDADANYMAGSKTITVTVKDPSTLINYNHAAAATEGITLESETSDKVVMANVKIHTNTDAVDCIQLGAGYTSSNAYVANDIKLSVDGGFKEGDQISIAGFFNNTSTTKVSKVDLFTLGENNAINVLWTSEQFINGRLVNDDPVVQTYTVTDDANVLYIGRNGDTGTNIYSIKAVRPTSVTKYTITCNEAQGGSVAASKTSSVAGSTITVTATPDADHEFESISVKAADESDVEVTDNKFTMPAQNVTVTATFKEKAKTYTVTVADAENGTVEATPKTDVAEGTEVTVTATPKFGYALSTLSYTAEGSTEPVTIENNKFNMPKANVTVNATFAETTVNYTTSLNIEQIVLDNGAYSGQITYDNIANDLANANIAVVDMDALDGLNDEKASRNEPFLGLKFKKATSKITLTVEAGKPVNVKFGNVGSDITVSGVAEGTVSAAGTYSVTPTTSGYLVFSHANDTKTIVLKQVMINEDIKDVVLPAPAPFELTAGTNGYTTYNYAYNFTASGDVKVYKALAPEGDVVTMEEVEGVIPANTGVIFKSNGNITITPTNDEYTADMEGNKLVAAGDAWAAGTNYVLMTDEAGTETKFFQVEGTLDISKLAGKCYLNVPDILAKQSLAINWGGTTAINAVNANANATVANGKFVKNGSIVIVKNGKKFNAAGAQVK